MADSPFGTSFGDPRKYMGQSQIGQAVKSGLLAYGMKKSGLTDWLDKLNKESKAGDIAGAAVPVVPQADVRRVDNQLEAAAPPMASAPVVPPTAGAAPVMPAAPTIPVPDQTQEPATQPQVSPSELGKQFMSGQVSSFVDPEAKRDIDVAQGGGFDMTRLTGNEYQQVPGYGKLAKALQAIAGAA